MLTGGDVGMLTETQQHSLERLSAIQCLQNFGSIAFLSHSKSCGAHSCMLLIPPMLMTSYFGALQVFVEKHRWISSTIFLELLALSQCLPGPTSTQVSFALGVVQKGVSGGLLTGKLRSVHIM